MNGNNNPLVSILIFSYNHEQYIAECLESILVQNYPNIELIVIDDCSPDKTWEIIENYKLRCKQKLHNINFILKDTNKGLVDSINQGVNVATGDFILMCASDDKLASNKTISKLVNTMRQLSKDYAIVSCDNQIIDENSSICYWDKNRENIYNKNKATYKSFGDFLKYERSEINFASEDYGSYKSILLGNYISNGYLTKLKAFKEILPLNKNAIDDWQIHLKMSKLYKYKYFDEPLFAYRWHGANTMKNQAKVYGLGIKAFFDEKDYCFKNGLKMTWLKKYLLMWFLKNIILKSPRLYNFVSDAYKKIINKKSKENL